MNLRTRILLATLSILVVTVVTFTIAAGRWLRESLEGSLAREIERETRLVTTILPQDPSAIPSVARRIGRLTGRRVTIIDSTGYVLADSEFDELSTELLENHLDRPEVIAALADEVGMARRYSESTHRVELKVAVAAWPGIVRLSAPIDEVDATVATAQRAALFAAFVALLAGLLLAAAAGRTIARPLNQLAAAARQVAQGGAATYPDSHAPEIRQLVHAFRDMQQQVTDRMGALERRQQESASLIESMAEGVIATDRRGSVQLCNPVARRLLGYGDDDDLPDLRELFHQREAREVVEHLFAGEAVGGVETMIEGRSLLLTGRPLPDGGVVLGLLDVTDLKRLQAVRRDFVANVSHELKTPLTSIFGYAETLLADPPDVETTRSFLRTIRDNAERMRRLVDDLLDLARLESGGWQPAWQTLVLDDMVEDAWQALTTRAERHGVALHKKFDAVARVAADPEALREILVNLFDNAIRHTPPGGRITVRLTHSDAGCEIQVADNGSGIPAAHVSRVFERFYRVDVGRSSAEGGTGLGLAIVKHFVEAHGGTVTIESEVGKGTSVNLRFPGS